MTDWKEILDHITVSDRDGWLRVCMALKYEGAPFDLFDAWSSTQYNYQGREDCLKTWNSCKRGSGVTGGTLIHLAKEGGWTPSQDGNGEQTNGEEDAYAGDRETIVYLRAMFQLEEIVCISSDDCFRDKTGKWKPTSGHPYKVCELIEAIEEKGIATVINLNKEAGAYIRVNPYDGKKGDDIHATAFRHVLIECDDIPLEEQIEAYKRFRLPMTAMVYSGSRSVHAIVRVDAKDHDQYKERVERLYSFLQSNGLKVDTQNKNVMRYSRLPGVARGSKRQRLLLVPEGMCRSWEEWTEFSGIDQRYFDLFKPASEIVEREQEWLVPGWFPQGQVSALAGDGGVGKTALWCNLAAAVSKGEASVFSQEPAKKGTILVCSGEDSADTVLIKRLRRAGADLSAIEILDFGADRNNLLADFKFGTELFIKILRSKRPALAIFDPIESFFPRDLQMGQRQHMRSCITPFISLGEDFGTSVLLIVHSNKRQDAAGRDRMADSGDLWDACRSVILCGSAGDGTFYAAHEKNNYGMLQQTILYHLEGGRASYLGTSTKRDRDFVHQRKQASGMRQAAEDFILEQLTAAGGKMRSRDLERNITAANLSGSYQRARDNLKKDGRISTTKTGEGWQISLMDTDDPLDRH